MLITEQLQHIDAKVFSLEGSRIADWNGYSATFEFVRLPSNVGGSQLWLHCACGRTVKRLYFYRAWLRCRHCLQLGYQSQLVDGYTRQIWREDRLRKLLPCGARRPKGMHLKTYRRIREAIRNAQEMQDYYFCLVALPILRRMR